MGQKIPVKFRKSSDVTRTYDYIEDGIGYIVYKGHNTKTSGASTYKLSREDIYSESVNTSGASTPTNSKVLDLDFDVDFSTQQIVEGPLICNVPTTIVGGGSPSQYILAKVRKWDGTTETELAQEWSSGLGGGDVPIILNWSVDVPKTTFKVGETLRITLALYGLSNPASKHIIFHDPQDRHKTGYSMDTTIAGFHLPFVLVDL